MNHCSEAVNVPDPERWWRWRRRLALTAMAMAMLETAYILVVDPGISGPVVAWSYGLWGSIIAAYIGAATWSDIAGGIPSPPS